MLNLIQSVLSTSLFLAILFPDKLQAKRDSEIVLGRQDVEVKSTLEKWLPLLEYLAEGTSRSVFIKLANTPDELRLSVQSNEIDMLFDTLYQFVIIDPEGTIEFTLNIWKKNEEDYQGCVATLKNTRLDFNNLSGKVIAFEDRYSTGSFALPLSSLMDQGFQLKNLEYISLKEQQKFLKLDNYLQVLDQIESRKFSYIFSQSDETSLHWLKRGYVDAIGMSCSDAEKISDLRIISRSKRVPRLILGFRRGFSAEIRQHMIMKLKSIPAGSTLLEKAAVASKVSDFEPMLLASAKAIVPLLKQIHQKAITDLGLATYD